MTNTPHHIKYGPLAHLVEHLTLNQGVRGSSPRRPTRKSIGFAEEAAEDKEEITAITNTVSYEGVEVSLADMGLVFLLPSDWVEVAAPENAQFAYASPDGVITMCGFLCSDFDTVAAGIDEQLQSGDIQPEVSEVTINDWYYILTATADNLTSYAYLYMTEENMFCFSFTAQDPDLEAPAYIMEMLGSVTEAAAE